MKKSVLIFALVLVLSFILSVSCFAAEGNTVTFSDNYSVLYLNGESFSKANTDGIVDLNVYATGQLYTSELGLKNGAIAEFEEYLNIELTDKQKDELNKVYVRSMGAEELFITAELYFKDGTTIWYPYVRDDVKSDLNKIQTSKTDEYVLKFSTYTEQGDILKSVKKENLLTGNKDRIDFWDYQEFEVVVFSEKYNYSIFKGSLFIKENEYYYFDFSESGLKNSCDLYNFETLTYIEAHKITDEETIAIIEEGLQEYYDGEYGYLYNESFTEPVAKIFFVLVFGLFPVAIAVTTFILAIKSKKGVYRNLLLVTCGLSVASLVTFIYIAFTLFNK